MATKKISQLTEMTVITDDDLFVVVDAPGGSPATKRITAANASSYFNGSGWTSSSETWTYFSASSFKISGDKTGKYKIGYKIKLTQTTDKYFVIATVTYAAPDTTITVVLSTDYTVANAAITAPYFSLSENPLGWPCWFNWLPTITGFSVNPTGIYRWNAQGRMMHLAIRQLSDGTSNSISFTLTAPVTTIFRTNMIWQDLCQVIDNSLLQPTAGFVFISNSSNSLVAKKALNSGNWTASGSKSIAYSSLIYEF